MTLKKRSASLTSIGRESYFDSKEEALKALTIADESGNPHIISWNGHEFEANPVILNYYAPDQGVYLQYNPYVEGLAIETAGVFHFPIDQQTKVSDWRSCRKAVPNADNTAWLPEWDIDTMIDYEEELRDATIARFQTQLDEAQVKVNEATNSVVRSTAVDNHRILTYFRNEVVATVEAWAQGKHIGWQEQNPHEAHVHLPILTAINKTALAWQTERAIDYGKVSRPVAAIIKDLSKTHAYETRGQGSQASRGGQGSVRSCRNPRLLVIFPHSPRRRGHDAQDHSERPPGAPAGD